MFDEKDKKSIEEELSTKTDIKKEEEVQIKVSNKSKRKGNFTHRFKSLKIKYKKDPKKFIVLASSIFVMLSVLIGSSYAYLSMTSKTDNSVVINSGTLALTFQNETNVISMENAVPMTIQDGLSQKQEYSFEVKNSGSIPASYTIALNNTCVEDGQIDLCIPDDYIKVGLKIGNEDYKLVEKNSDGKYVFETESLMKDETKSYKMKIWLDYDTPNIYNAKKGKKVVYKAKLGLNYEQGSTVKEESVAYSYSNQNVVIGDSLLKIQNAVASFNKLNKEVFLRHVIGGNNKIERTDVCVLNGDKATCVKGEQTKDVNGTLLVQEGYVGKYYEENNAVLTSLFNQNNCNTTSDGISCSAKGYNVAIYKSGAVSASYASLSCTAGSNGISSCV